jgi:hypothetical protein
MAPPNSRTTIARDGARSNQGADVRASGPGPLRSSGMPTTTPAPENSVRAESGEINSGSAMVIGPGLAAVARIPVPGTNGLFIELKARGWTPTGGSTSALFIQDSTGRRHLRLDYGYNARSGRVDYHWNQQGTHAEFGITNHEGAEAGEALYRGARALRYAGRVFLVAGLAMDLYSVVVARKRWRQVARVAAGWAGGWAGCETVGAGGAYLGTMVEPGVGTAVGGLGGCIVGGIAGYAGASWAAGQAYDWVEETYFEPVPEVTHAEAGR